jgi:hypothetical protein
MRPVVDEKPTSARGRRAAVLALNASMMGLYDIPGHSSRTCATGCIIVALFSGQGGT